MINLAGAVGDDRVGFLTSPGRACRQFIAPALSNIELRARGL